MNSSIMARESKESADSISTLIKYNRSTFDGLAESFKLSPPLGIMTVGRGSSDHVGVFAKYLFETQCGIPVFSAAPSVASVFNKTLNLKGFLAIAISQSGQSPDIVSQLKYAKEGGAYCIAIVNNSSSPLAKVADVVIDMCAGEEIAVAATKSYLCSLAALLGLCASWTKDTSLQESLKTLPSQLARAGSMPAMLTKDNFHISERCIVVGRGFGYAISKEIALKLKEVLGVQAEAFSSAEFLHGPVTLASKTISVVSISLNDATGYIHDQIVLDLQAREAEIIDISVGEDVHNLLQPLLIVQRFYLDLAALAASRGLNPDKPPGLQKVTETK
ncbi:glucosamine-6-phosphate deaminase NagB-II [Agaribacter flavus]|uniref:Glucosamine-6-phosphate deaminase NagB-II n=1 Tax=Agaribacter flavus TaxID=1902781 RepID=A0ABV7FNV5_9ALTE